jgi:hypothetical protein
VASGTVNIYNGKRGSTYKFSMVRGKLISIMESRARAVCTYS